MLYHLSHNKQREECDGWWLPRCRSSVVKAKNAFNCDNLWVDKTSSYSATFQSQGSLFGRTVLETNNTNIHRANSGDNIQCMTTHDSSAGTFLGTYRLSQPNTKILELQQISTVTVWITSHDVITMLQSLVSEPVQLWLVSEPVQLWLVLEPDHMWGSGSVCLPQMHLLTWQCVDTCIARE